MPTKTELHNIRTRRIEFINKHLLKEGYEIAIHREGDRQILGLYKPAPSKEDIPQYLKNLTSGQYKELDFYIAGMYDGINIIE